MLDFNLDIFSIISIGDFENNQYFQIYLYREPNDLGANIYMVYNS